VLDRDSKGVEVLGVKVLGIPPEPDTRHPAPGFYFCLCDYQSTLTGALAVS